MTLPNAETPLLIIAYSIKSKKVNQQLTEQKGHFIRQDDKRQDMQVFAYSLPVLHHILQ